MDSLDWLAQARRSQPDPPSRPAGGGDGERAAYADAVHAHLRSTLLPSPRHDAVRDALSRDLALVEDEPAGARTILALSAPYTAGKSSLVKAWAQPLHLGWLGDAAADALPSWSPEAGYTADLVPVVYVTMMARTNARGLYAAILAFLRHGTHHRGDITLAATEAMRRHGVRLLVVDDAHMLNTALITGRATLDALKQINTELGELGGTLMLVGANLTGGDALSDAQIRGRLFEHALAPYRLDRPGEIRDWQNFLTGLEPILRPFLPHLPSGELATALGAVIFKRTQGFVGDVRALLAVATASAVRDGRATLVPADFAEARLSSRARDGEALLTGIPRSAAEQSAPSQVRVAR